LAGGAEESGAAQFGFSAAMLLDLLDRPSRCSGSWPHDSMVRSPAAPRILVRRFLAAGWADFFFGIRRRRGVGAMG
jgi:hypothetical protein